MKPTWWFGVSGRISSGSFDLGNSKVECDSTVYRSSSEDTIVGEVEEVIIRCYERF